MDNPAETYERFMVPPLFGPSAQRLVDAAGPRPGDRVLDVACGTGIVGRIAARLDPAITVTGLDVSPHMLAVARSMAAREGVTIDWQEGRAEALPFTDGSFDLVLCQYALMFFADRPAATSEMARVLANGGRLAASVFQTTERHPFYQALDTAIERHLGMSGARDIFAFGDPVELRRLLSGAGFRDIRIEPVSLTARFPDPEQFLAGEIDVDTASIPAMQHLDASARRDLTGAIREEMMESLREVTVGDHVVITFHTYIAHGAW